MPFDNNSVGDPSWPHDRTIHAWWVIPGRLLAGEYPGSIDPVKAAQKRQVLLDAGVNSYVNLTESGELAGGGRPLKPYHELLIAEAQDRGLSLPEHHRFEIPDTYIIDDAGYDSILEHIGRELDSGKVVYVHCWGGKGRTGTVVRILADRARGSGLRGNPATPAGTATRNPKGRPPGSGHRSAARGPTPTSTTNGGVSMTSHDCFERIAGHQIRSGLAHMVAEPSPPDEPKDVGTPG